MSSDDDVDDAAVEDTNVKEAIDTPLAIDGTNVSTQNSSLPAWLTLPVYNKRGKKFDRPWEGDNGRAILLAINRTAVDKRVFLVLSSNAFHDIVLNWVCSARRQGITNILILATQIKTLTNLRKAKISTAWLDVPVGNRKWKKTYNYHEALWMARWEVVLLALRAGFDVLHVDSDAPFVGNPAKIYKMDVDVVFSRDVPQLEWLFCMGWVYFKATFASILLVRRFMERMDMGVPGAPSSSHHDDQLALNYFLLHQSDIRWMARANPLDWHTFNQTLGASKRIVKERLKLGLLPNTMIWRNDCDPTKSTGDDLVAIHCRVVGNLLVTQDVHARDKSAGIRSMGAWFLDQHNECDYGVKYNHTRTGQGTPQTVGSISSSNQSVIELVANRSFSAAVSEPNSTTDDEITETSVDDPAGG